MVRCILFFYPFILLIYYMLVDKYLVDASTICWRHASTDPSQPKASIDDRLNASLLKGSSSTCPVSIQFLDLKSSRRVEEETKITWTINLVDNITYTSVDNHLRRNQEGVGYSPITGTLCLCLFSNVSCYGDDQLIYKKMQFLHVPLEHGRETRLTANIHLESPGKYGVYAGIHIPLSDVVTEHALSGLQTFSVQEAAIQKGGPANHKNHNGMLIACAVLAATLFMLVGFSILLCKRRARVQSKPSTVTTITHDPPPSLLTKWSEVYANDEPLPSSILIDDDSTLAIMRASRLSSPVATKQLFESPWDLQMRSLSPDDGFYSNVFTSWPQSTSQIADISDENISAIFTDPTWSDPHERSHSSSLPIQCR